MKKTIKLHKYQDRAIFAKERFVAMISGLQSGKTISGAVWTRKQFDENEKQDGLIAAPTYKILHQSTLPKFFEINPDLKRFYKKSDSLIEVPDRGKIYIRSTENPNVIEGMTLKWIWADEAGQMKIDAWINFQGRLSILKGSLFITTTPYTTNWLAREFYEQYRLKHPDYNVIQFKSKDNPYFPNEEYERVRATMDTRTFRRRYDGILESMEGLVYDEFNPTIHTIAPKDIKYKEYICGIDWGYTNPASIIVLGIDNDNNVDIVDEYYQSGKTTSELIEIMKGYKHKYNIRFWYPDPAEPDRLEEMRRAGLFPRDVKKGKDSIRLGIDKIRELIKQGSFHIYNTCRFTLEEMSMYRYPDPLEGQNEKEDPIKENDHCLDAIRYAIMTYQPTIITNNFTTKNKTFFR